MICLAVIPARKDSERLPNKNKKILNGKPMIAYTIEEAKKSKLIDTIVVSTNDEDIKTIASEYGVHYISRPEELATNNTKTIDVLKHSIELFDEYIPTIIVLLQPTSPLRTADDIDNCISKFMNSEFSSIVTVTKMTALDFTLNGSVYVTTPEMIDKNKIWDDDVGLVVTPFRNSVDVDTEKDFMLCEIYLELRKDD